MDDEQCAVCGRGTSFGQLYCSAACHAVEAGSAISQPLGRATVSAGRTYPSPFTSYTRRDSLSIDISASDRESSSAASASSLRFTSPPSSLDDDDAVGPAVSADLLLAKMQPARSLAPAIPRPGSAALPRDDYDMHVSRVDPSAHRHHHHPPPAFGLKLQFARRPSQTNNRSTIPAFVSAHRRTASHGGSALADSPVGGSPLARREEPMVHHHPHTARPRVERKMPTAPPPAIPPPSSPVPLPAKRARSSLPMQLARMRMSPAPSPPAMPLVTMTNIDARGEASFSPTRTAGSPGSTVEATPPAPVERSTSAATVRVARRLDDAEADESETENLVEPLRGRGRTRTRVRRDSTPGVGVQAGERPAFLARVRRVERSRERSPRPRERRMSMRI